MFVYQPQATNQKGNVYQQGFSITVEEGFINNKPLLSSGNKKSNKLKTALKTYRLV